MKRLLLFTGIAIGYVLGTRGGRARYESLARTVRSVADRPEVQSTAGILSAHAAKLARGAVGKDRDDAAVHVSPN